MYGRDAGLSLRYAELCNQKLQFLLRRIELLTMQSCRGQVIAHLLAGQDRNGCVKPTGSGGGPRTPAGRQPGGAVPGTGGPSIHGRPAVRGKSPHRADAPALENLLYHPPAPNDQGKEVPYQLKKLLSVLHTVLSAALLADAPAENGNTNAAADGASPLLRP